MSQAGPVSVFVLSGVQLYAEGPAYRRELWARHPFERVPVGEDSRFVLGTQAFRVDLADPALVIATIHAGNSAVKVRGASWRPVPVRAVTTAQQRATP